MHELKNQNILQTLDRLHTEANSSRQKWTLLQGLFRGFLRRPRVEDFRDAYIPISKEQGEWIFDCIVEKKAQTLVEFGTSFGISTLYLAAAAEVTRGHVITSELIPEKAAIARKNFTEAGVSSLIELREGDAQKTLQSIDGTIDFVLMDGWKDLYLSILKILEPRFKKGTIIYTDNANFPGTKPYIEYLRTSSNYTSNHQRTNKGAVELSTYLGDA